MARPMIARMQKEIAMLSEDPPYGICAWPVGEVMDSLRAQIKGPEGSPYEKGTFLLEIEVPPRYPFEPPKVKFLTPIFHPNIDSAGRICLDTLKMKPKGSWSPSVNLNTLLTTIRLLMAEPNADDGLMPDITELYQKNKNEFIKQAVEWTAKHATSAQTIQMEMKTRPNGNHNLKETAATNNSEKTVFDDEEEDEEGEEEDDEEDDDEEDDDEEDDDEEEDRVSKKTKVE